VLIVKTKEPSDNPIGKMIRDEYLSGYHKTDPQVMKLLYAADRLDNITESESGIKTMLDSGMYVISDRCFLSTCAYDTYDIVLKNINKSKVERLNYKTQSRFNSDFSKEIVKTLSLNEKALNICIPDIIFYIDIDAKTAMERINARGGHKDIYENETMLNVIREAYTMTIPVLRYLNYPTKIFTIEGDSDSNHITDYIVNCIRYELMERHVI
jgi:thymidylate kinase